MSESRRDAHAGQVGFIGLGNMGRPMAANLASSIGPLVVYDAAGTQERAPADAICAESARAVSDRADTILLSLPDADAAHSVVTEILTAGANTIADLSTIGSKAARELDEICRTAGVEYVDAPVSGGVSGAVAASISVMYSGSAGTLERLRPLFDAIAANVFHVGALAGQGQTMKVLNNFLSGTALAATSEAVAMGVKCGLEMAEF